jgi:hypothetical protein
MVGVEMTEAGPSATRMRVVKRWVSVVESLATGRVTESLAIGVLTEASGALEAIGEFVNVCVRVKILELSTVETSTVTVSRTVTKSVMVSETTLGAAQELLVGNGVAKGAGTLVMVLVNVLTIPSPDGTVKVSIEFEA